MTRIVIYTKVKRFKFKQKFKVLNTNSNLFLNSTYFRFINSRKEMKLFSRCTLGHPNLFNSFDDLKQNVSHSLKCFTPTYLGKRKWSINLGSFGMLKVNTVAYSMKKIVGIYSGYFKAIIIGSGYSWSPSDSTGNRSTSNEICFKSWVVFKISWVEIFWVNSTTTVWTVWKGNLVVAPFFKSADLSVRSAGLYLLSRQMKRVRKQRRKQTKYTIQH